MYLIMYFKKFKLIKIFTNNLIFQLSCQFHIYYLAGTAEKFWLMSYLSFRAWDPHETYGSWYWGQMESFYPKKFLVKVCEKKFFFLVPPQEIFLFWLILTFSKFNHNLDQILSTDFKFHEKISIRLKVRAFWIIRNFFFIKIFIYKPNVIIYWFYFFLTNGH